MENEGSSERNVLNSPNAKSMEVDSADDLIEKQILPSEREPVTVAEEDSNLHHAEEEEQSHDQIVEIREVEPLNISNENPDVLHDKGGEQPHMLETSKLESLNITEEIQHNKEARESHDPTVEAGGESVDQEETNHTTDKTLEEEQEPVFDGTEIPDGEAIRSSSTQSLDIDGEGQGNAWPDKAAALKNFVKQKSVVAVSSMIRRLSGRKNEDDKSLPDGEEKVDKEKDENTSSSVKEEEDSTPESKPEEVVQKTVERSMWNPLSFIKTSRESDTSSKDDQAEDVAIEDSLQDSLLPSKKARITLYTRLGCQDCREVRVLLHHKMLSYVEINIDVYPSRKSELEKFTGSSSVPNVFFNEVPIGGLKELKAMDESGLLDDKIKELRTKEPSSGAPLPPLSGEDDVSCSGAVDELAVIVRKMKESILVKDRFCKMRRVTNCFLGSEAVNFLSEDQYLERQEAIEFGRKLASKQFFRHINDENVFEDGNHLYRFLDHDPIVSSCHNIPRGITNVKPKPLVEISSRLRFLSFAMFEAYTSEDGRHVDYRSIHGSEEFARYLRVVEELQRVDLQTLSREEKLAFFINLHNMMAIHAILSWGYPVGALERRKMLGDFKYVIGGCTYSLSAIQNGILRANQRPPYNITKPFGGKDSRLKVALSYPEPLIHFALVYGTKSGPALRCYSPGDIDKELVEAARNFLRNGGVSVDPEAKAASANKILKWYSVDFGKNEVEVLKHAANYLEPTKSAELLELLASTQLKVTYQPYDWGLNC